MYFLALGIFVLIVLFTFIFSSGLAIYFDFPTLLILITIFFSMMYSSGLFNSFTNAFNMVILKNKIFPILELKKSYHAITLAIKIILVSGIMLSIIGSIGLLANIDDPSLIGKSFAVAILAILYTLLTILIFLPIQYKIKSLIDEQNSL